MFSLTRCMANINRLLISVMERVLPVISAQSHLCACPGCRGIVIRWEWPAEALPYRLISWMGSLR
jgi:hypothetical protein